MERKIREYVKKYRLGKVVSIKQVNNWWKGRRYHVVVQKLRRKEFDIYECDGEIVTAKNIWTGKEYGTN